jgi:hypothetical protein
MFLVSHALEAMYLWIEDLLGFFDEGTLLKISVWIGNLVTTLDGLM